MQSSDEHGIANIYEPLLPNFEKVISTDSRGRIDTLIRGFASLKDAEKLLFCLLLPTEQTGIGSSGICEDDYSANGFEINSLGVGMFSSSGNSSSLHLSNQVEQSQAYTWILSHLEEDESTCLRKDEVYDDYRIYCEKHNQKMLNTADFGKVMKRAFPNVKPRRLGQRGQSRYCYGGMRKKREVKPPSLPDLTLELSTAPPRSSAPSSGSSSANMEERHLSGSSVGSVSSSTAAAVSNWPPTEELRSTLGVTGSLLTDVANILLEYAQNIFGLSFNSLLHLAQHLVTNRYVHASSRHALALLAHLSNPSKTPIAASTAVCATTNSLSSSSPSLLTPSAAASNALAEAIRNSFHGQLTKQQADVSNHNQPFSVSTQSSPTVHRKDRMIKKEAISPRTEGPQINVDLSNSGAGTRNSRTPAVRVAPPLEPQTHSSSIGAASGIAAAPFSAALTTAEASAAYRSPLAAPTTTNFDSATIAAVYPAMSSSSATQQTFNLSQFSTTASTTSGLQNLAGRLLGTATQRNPYAAMNAYLQQQQQLVYAQSSNTATTDQRRMSCSDSASTDGAYLTGGDAAAATTNAYCASSTPATPYANRSMETYNTNSSNLGYTATNGAHSFAHQHHHHQQPPAPLPPTVGARSPYAPVVSAYKASSTQLPVDAPGAHEPLARVHLGGSSPSKQSNHFGSLSSTNPYGHMGSYQQQQHLNNAAGRPSPNATSASIDSSGRPLHQRQSGSASFYSGAYDSTVLLSPATTPCPSVTSTQLVGGSSWQAEHQSTATTSISSRMTRATEPYRGFDSDLGGLVGTARLDNDEDDGDYGFPTMPRLGASPGPPAIPPSSPTEFLSFYSAETAARRQKQHSTARMDEGGAVTTPEDLDKTLTNLSPSPSRKRQQESLNVAVTEDDAGHSARKREEMHDALLTPSGESGASTNSISPCTTPHRDFFKPTADILPTLATARPSSASAAVTTGDVVRSDLGGTEKPASGADGASVTAF